MAYRIEFSPKAARQFRKLSKQVQKQLQPRIDALADNLLPARVKKLEDEENLPISGRDSSDN